MQRALATSLIVRNPKENVDTAARNWYALFVKSRHEFVTSSELSKKGVETFLPSVKRLRMWKDRRKIVEFPLFPGYVFVHTKSDAQTFLDVIRTRGTVSFVTYEPGRPASIDGAEIEALRRMVNNDQSLDVYPHLSEGSSVRIKKGPLRDIEGVLLEKDYSHIFIVNIEILGRSVGMKVHAEDLERI